MVAAGLREPIFTPDGFFRAVFYRSPDFAMKADTVKHPKKPLTGDTSGLADRLAEGLAENQKKILILAAQNPCVSKKSMAIEIGVSTTAIDKNIAVLKQKGILRRVGPDRGGHWEIVRNNEI